MEKLEGAATCPSGSEGAVDGGQQGPHDGGQQRSPRGEQHSPRGDFGIECDYLVQGAGACSMAFVDNLLAGAKAAKSKVAVIIVDEHDRPGGHWVEAYTFAQLHHESAHYGVSSRKLEPQAQERRRREGGVHRACTGEILVYYSQVMEDFIETGCVQFFPMCRYEDGKIQSLVDEDRVWRVKGGCRLVDSSYTSVRSHATRAPPFDVGFGAMVVPPNYLTSLPTPAPRYVVLGGGRTGVDTILWLLQRQVQPTKIQWVVPRDQWFMPRERIDGAEMSISAVSFKKALADSKDWDDLIVLFERRKLLCRVDPSQYSDCFHGTAICNDELLQLRRVTNVVRMGRVRAVCPDQLLLEKGSVALPPGALVVDCTNSRRGKDRPEPVPIFQPDRIVIQPVQEAFVGVGEFSIVCSAGLLGYLEGYSKKDAWKNKACTPGKFTDRLQDWFEMHITEERNAALLWSHPKINAWFIENRLSLFSAMDLQDLRNLKGNAGLFFCDLATKIEGYLAKDQLQKEQAGEVSTAPSTPREVEA